MDKDEVKALPTMTTGHLTEKNLLSYTKISGGNEPKSIVTCENLGNTYQKQKQNTSHNQRIY